jgi:hypothetical protein
LGDDDVVVDGGREDDSTEDRRRGERLAVWVAITGGVEAGPLEDSG